MKRIASSTQKAATEGRDVRCIVSVGMLTEGWDCDTVTHIVGLRPFMSQLLCEQVVGRGFAIAYLHNGRPHDYIPDFIIRLTGDGTRYLILETKGFDDLAEVKAAAAKRWCAAVNADGQFGSWDYVMVRSVGQVSVVLG